MLQQLHMNIVITYEILLSLHEMFGDKGTPTKQATLRTIMNTRIIKGTLIRYHMIRMINYTI